MWSASSSVLSGTGFTDDTRSDDPQPDAEAGELQKIRDKYFDDIFTERLYGYLSPESQIALSRSAVYGVPVTLEGLAAAAGVAPDVVAVFAKDWEDRTFAYRDTEKSLWSIYGLLRWWLMAKISSEERMTAHKAAGDFLNEIHLQKREGEQDLNWLDCLMEARAQYLQAKEYGQARKINDIISIRFERYGIYEEVVQLNQEMLGYEEHPLPMNRIAMVYECRGHLREAREWYQRSLDASADKTAEAGMAWNGLAGIDYQQGNYKDAQDKYQKSLAIASLIGNKQGEATVLHNLAMIDLILSKQDEALKKFQTSLELGQEIGDRRNEAAILHGLAIIDLRLSKYDLAIEKFQTSLKINQEIGDREGEAATFYQLGLLAKSQGRAHDGVRLIALCYLIYAYIGHGEAQNAFKSVSSMASELNYTKEQLDAALKDLEESYGEDQGKGLLEAAFGKGGI